MDEVDMKICGILHMNSRISIRDLGDKLDLSVNSVHKRINSLVEDGVIETFVLLPGTPIEAISILIMGNSQCQSMDECVANLSHNKNVWKVIVGLDNRLSISCIIPKLDKLRELTDFVIKTADLENYEVGIFEESYSKESAGEDDEKRPTLTKLDYRIIHSFSKNSRRPISDVADELNVSPKTIKRRLSKLEKEKLVTSGIYWQPTMTNDIITYLYMTIGPDIDVKNLWPTLKNTYKTNFITVYTFGNLPDFAVGVFWTKTMREMNEIQQSLRKDGGFKSIRSNMQYRAYHFDTWVNDLILKRAEF